MMKEKRIKPDIIINCYLLRVINRYLLRIINTLIVMDAELNCKSKVL
jgi:hypothetical protein